MKPLPYIPGLEPYEPGKPIEEVEAQLGLASVAKLASNENPLGPSPKAMTAMQGALATLHRYPDGGAIRLRERVAAHLGVLPAMVIVGNGSDELIELILKTFVGRQGEILTAEPSFLEYRLLAQGLGVRCIEVPLRDFRYDLDRMAKRVTARTKAVFIANPNNPTGTYVTHEEVRAFLGRLPPSVVAVFDEAYYEFVDAPDFPKSVELVNRLPVIVLRTFSKAYGLSGIRVGYGIARAPWIDWINRVRQPFNVNRLAQVGAIAALEDADHLRRSQQAIREGRQYLVAELERLGGECVPAAANFILVKVGRRGRAVFQALLRKGVIVRAMDAYGLPGYLRVTVGTMPENQKFIRALEGILKR